MCTKIKGQWIKIKLRLDAKLIHFKLHIKYDSVLSREERMETRRTGIIALSSGETYFDNAVNLSLQASILLLMYLFFFLGTFINQIAK